MVKCSIIALMVLCIEVLHYVLYKVLRHRVTHKVFKWELVRALVTHSTTSVTKQHTSKCSREREMLVPW